MAVSKYYRVEESTQEIGKIEIHSQVFEVIAHNATAEIEGVSKMFESISQSIADTFNSKKHRNGIEIEFNDEGLTVDVYVSIKAGYTINEVAEKIQKNIHQMIYHMTSVKANEIFVHVVSIDFE
ncbi:MAG: Asp23/Gls24 family envelope stress response protein [Turicibacter sp.]